MPPNNPIDPHTDPALENIVKMPSRPTPTQSPLGGVWASDLGPIAPPRWTVKGLVPAQTFGVLYGPPGCFKTFAALDLALSMAAGFDWLGRRTEHAAVLYLASEGGDGLPRRVAGWAKHHGTSLPDTFRLVRAPTPITDNETVEAVLGEALFMRAAGHPPGLIVIDTLARALAGADENSASDMGKAIAAIERISRETGATVLVVHHTGKNANAGARGSSALLGAASFMLEMRGVGVLGADLIVEKEKDGPDGGQIALDLIQMELGHDDDGEPFSTLVCTGSSRKPSKANASSKKLTDKQHGDLKVVREVINRTGSPDRINGRSVTLTSRDLVRDALIEHDRIYVADPNGTLTPALTDKGLDNAARQRLHVVLKALKDKDKIGYNKTRVWLFDADQEEEL